MGLMYIFPTEDSEIEIIGGRVENTNNKLILKTYGLPMIFWGYLIAIFIVLFTMALVTKNILLKMLSYNDFFLNLLAYLVLFLFIFGPIILLGFYFYEKILIKEKKDLIIKHRIFFMTILTKKIQLDQNDAFVVEHFLDSPNVAKTKNSPDLRGFENRGYFELKALTQGKKLTIDRSSRKIDLEKMSGILSKY